MSPQKRPKLPTAGDAFAVPLKDGRWTVCRVLADRETRPALSIDAVLVACSEWIGVEVPEADDPRLRNILRLDHHSHAGNPLTVWIDKKVPQYFVPIGKIPPTSEEAQLESPSHAEWVYLQAQPFMQWQWDHDRTGALAEDKQRKQMIEQDREAAYRARVEFLEQITLEKLKQHQFFSHWSLPPGEATTAARELMQETIDRLLNMPEDSSKTQQLRILQQCVESFNQLDEKWEFIETEEREDICEELEAILYAIDLEKHQDLVDEWREW